MKCEICNKVDAEVVHYRELDDRRQEMYVCRACRAKELGEPLSASQLASDVVDVMRSAGLPMNVVFDAAIKPPPDVADIDVRQIEARLGALPDFMELKCPTCGTNALHCLHNNRGRLGCAECYVTFGELLRQFVLKASQPGTKHIGHRPRKEGEGGS